MVHIKNHDIEKITLAVLDKLYNEYSFLEKDKNKFKDKYIVNLLTLDKELQNVNDLYDKLLTNLYNVLKKEFEKGKFLNIIKNYINDKFIDDEIGLSKFLFIDIILEKTEYEYSSEEICDIVKIKKIDKILSEFLNKEQALIDNFRENSSFLDSLIDTYQVSKDDSFNIGQEEYFSDDIVKMYLNEIRKYELLSKDEEVELMLSYKNGDMSAKEKMINHNLRLSPYIAKRYINRGIPFMDLIQEGNLGIITAVEKFDIKKGNKFATYAIWWIRQVIERYIQNNSRQLRLPVNLQEKYMKYMVAKEELKKELKREPTTEEIASRTKLSLSQIERVESILDVNVVSINKSVNDEEDSELSDLISNYSDMPEVITEKTTLKREVAKLLEKSDLNEREKIVIKMRFGLDNEFGIGLTFYEISEIFGVTHQAIQQIESRALKVLLCTKGIEDYVVYLDNPDKALDKLSSNEDSHYIRSYRSFSNYDKETANIKYKEIIEKKRKKKLRNLDTLEKDKKESENVMEKENKVVLEEEQIENVKVLETIDKEPITNNELVDEKKNANTSRIRKNWKNLDECYSEYDRNLRNLACSKLEPRYQELMHKRYGEDLINHGYNENLSPQEKRSLYYTVLPKFERILANLSKKNNEEIKTNEAKENNIVKEEAIIDKKTDIIPKENCNNILSIFNNPVFIEFTKTKPIEECLIISLVLGFGNVKSLSTTEVADILKMDKEKVDSIVKNSLYDLKIMLNKMIDDAIVEKCNSKEKTLVKTKLSNSEN